MNEAEKAKRIIALFNKQKGKCYECGKVLSGFYLSEEVDVVLCNLPCGHAAWKREKVDEIRSPVRSGC